MQSAINVVSIPELKKTHAIYTPPPHKDANIRITKEHKKKSN